MDNNLKLLISFYEEEKVQLQKLIKEYVAEADYLMAYCNSKALGLIEERLQTLNIIDDELHYKKTFWQNEIDRLQAGMEDEFTRYLKERYEKALQEAGEKPVELNQVPKQSTAAGGITLLDETLAKLLQKKISNLKLILKRDDNMFIRISYSNNILKASLPHVKQLTKKWVLQNENIDSFKILGFDLVTNGDKLVLTLTGDKEEILNRLKITLSKIVFEVFYFKKFKNESYIQFTEKPNRLQVK